MKILIICDEVWNDKINPNNVLSNWFNNFPAEFANIYASPGLPFNSCCKKYFQLTDSMMVKSILKKVPAGKIVTDEYTIDDEFSIYNSTDVKNIGFLRRYFGNSLRLMKSIVWENGKYDTKLLKKFIEDFKPDMIFSARFATTKILRLEKEVLKYANCPIVAFTGDNEYSLKRFEFSPIAWYNLFHLRCKLRKMVHYYSLYYTLSSEQLNEYRDVFSINMKLLMKCNDFGADYKKKTINEPIRIVYAGKLYMNRWKTLAEIGKVLKKINSENVKMILDIYTQDKPTKKQRELLNDNRSIILNGRVSTKELQEIYAKSDIALHVESFNLKQRYATRVSFSTKIIDCLASSCAVMVIAWNKHTGYTYLKNKDAAICIDNYDKLYTYFEYLCNNPEQISIYQKKAWECGKRNHQIDKIQKMLYDDFERVIYENNKA